MPKSTINKFFSSEIIVYINEPNFFSSFYIQKSCIKIPKSFQKISINKSPHVFKKSKERFINYKPVKIHMVTPFFSNIVLINSFLKVLIGYIFYLSFSAQVKIVNRVTLSNLS